MLEILESMKTVRQTPNPHTEFAQIPVPETRRKEGSLESEKCLWQMGLQIDGGSLAFRNEQTNSFQEKAELIERSKFCRFFCDPGKC